MSECELELANLRDDVDLLWVRTSPKIWVLNAFKYTGLRDKLLPWIGTDGTPSGQWWRQTLVIPILGLFMIVIGGKWQQEATHEHN